MPRIEKPAPQKILQRFYSEVELKALDNELETYRETIILSNGEAGSVVNLKRYHVAQRSMTSDGAVVIEKDTFGDIITPIKYAVIEDKLEQWGKWKRKRDFGEKKRLEKLDEVAKSMRITQDEL